MDSPLEEKRWQALGQYIDRLRSKHVMVTCGGLRDYEYILISFKGSSLASRERVNQAWRPWATINSVEQHWSITTLERECLKSVVGPLMKMIVAEIARIWKEGA